MKIPIKGISYCSICHMGILNWIIRFEEITQKEKTSLVIRSSKKKDLQRFRPEVSGEEECDPENTKCL